MRRTTYAVAGTLSMALIGLALTSMVTAAPSPTGPGSRAAEAIKSGAISVHRDSAGAVNYLSIRPGHPLAAPSGMSARSASGAATVARANVNDFAPLFGVKNPTTDLSPVKTVAQGANSLVRFQQTHNGVPIIGAQLVVTENASGALEAINGTGASVDAVSTTPTVSASAAATTAISAVAGSTKVAATSLVASKPKLSIYDPSLLGAPDSFGNRAVYQFVVTSPSHPSVNQYVLVDAHLGAVALSFSQNNTVAAPDSAPVTNAATRAAATPADGGDPIPGNPSRTVCDFNDKPVADNDPTCPGEGTTIDHPENSSNNDILDAYTFTGEVSDFYHALGRAGIDNHDLPLLSSTDFCYTVDFGFGCPYANAFWNGSQMVFGRGYAVAPDVVGHELTHGVTQDTSGLLYYYQSGSINESISDVMGEMFQQWLSGNPQSDPSWLLGEALPGGAIRSMSNPPAFDQPGSVTSSLWSTDPLDDGGVHTDSGPGNHAAYLAAVGGTYRDIVVPGITDDPVTKIAAIWLGADELLTPGATYASFDSALKQSCINQESATIAGTVTLPADCTSVDDAVDAVNMTGTPTVGGAIPQAYTCGSGYAPISAFTDNFNRVEGDKLGTAWTQTGSPFIAYDASPSVAAGGAMLIPDYNDTKPVTRYAYTAKPIKLSSAHTNYLYFQHLDSFDWLPDSDVYGTSLEYFDGGFISYSTNGGSTWTAASTAKANWVNGPTKPIDHTWDSHGNVTSHATGFGGDSRGWTSSRLTLPSSLKGKSVEVRFSVTTDGFPSNSTGYGFFVDNVSVHNCFKTPLAPTSVVFSGFHGQASISWAGSSTNGGAAIKAYAVYIEPAGATSYTRTTLSPSARSFTFPNLTSGKDYKFEIRTENTDGVYSPYVTGSLAGASITLTPATQSTPGAVLSGQLTASTSHTGLSNRAITLFQRPTGTTTWTQSTTTATTDATGNFTFNVAPTVNEDYYVQYSTGSHTSMGVASATVAVTVAP